MCTKGFSKNLFGTMAKPLLERAKEKRLAREAAGATPSQPKKVAWTVNAAQSLTQPGLGSQASAARSLFERL